MGPGQDRLLALDTTLAGVRTARCGGDLENGCVQAPISLEEVLGQAPGWSDLVEAVISGLSGVMGGDWYRGELKEPERAKYMALAERYTSAEWTWCR